MTEIFIEQVSLNQIDAVYPETMLSLFWEQGMEQIRGMAGRHSPTPGSPSDPAKPSHPAGGDALDGDLTRLGAHSTPEVEDGGKGLSGGDIDPILAEQIRLEKEAWLNTVFLSWGPCGYSLRKRSPNSVAGEAARTVGTLLFAPPRFCPTTFSMPSGPISPDAIVLTSLHYNPLEVDGDMLCALIASTLHKLALRGVHAVEAFGCSRAMDATEGEPELPPITNALDDGAANLIADFEEQMEEALNPKPCVSDSLSAINHKAGDLIRTRTLIDAGFNVVTPHPIHPKLRIELDAELDWDEEVGHALDLSAKEPFMRSRMFSI